jgi:DNA-binding Lrp family transcriptional regulator
MREQILTILEKDCRIDLKELAILLGTDEETIAEEIVAMETQGIICGYHAMIDWEKCSVEKVTALIEVRVAPQRDQGYDRVAERIYNYPEVDSVYLKAGSYDLMVTIDGETLRSGANFVSEKLAPIEGVLSTATHFILKKYKDHGTILVKEHDVDNREKVSP